MSASWWNEVKGSFALKNFFYANEDIFHETFADSLAEFGSIFLSFQVLYDILQY
jgi:hypothetical protein